MTVPPAPSRLPDLVKQKLYKTGQTRGAATAEIYQNRVGRNSTVLIPFSHWQACQLPDGGIYEKGSIVLIAADDYFRDPSALADAGLVLGRNALVFYARRADWTRWPVDEHGWVPAVSRLDPLGGQFVARVPGTTGADVPPIREGFTTTAARGAGIRVYEYATTATIGRVRTQLEVLLWLCHDSRTVFEQNGMTRAEIALRSEWAVAAAADANLLDLDHLRRSRTIDGDKRTVCPLCLEPMSAHAFSDRVRQAEGRERLESRITEGSLFHIRELRVGELGHRPYNVGWGHHHCNVVAKDSGIPVTIDWMRDVISRNDAS